MRLFVRPPTDPPPPTDLPISVCQWIDRSVLPPPDSLPHRHMSIRLLAHWPVCPLSLLKAMGMAMSGMMGISGTTSDTLGEEKGRSCLLYTSDAADEERLV